MMASTSDGQRVESGLGHGAGLHYQMDDCTDPWTHSDVILMIHGIAEDGGLWKPWVPHLARRHRVLRPDLRGFGRSPPLPSGQAFALESWADDLERLIAVLEEVRVHLVATKLGAQVAFLLAERRPAWLASMTLAGMLPSPRAALSPWLDEWLAMIERHGVEHWARETMVGRMGSSLPPEAMRWWATSMGRAPKASVIACLAALAGIDGPLDPGRIECPTLFVVGAAATDDPARYGQRPATDALMRLKDRVRGATVATIPADSFHIAATHPDDCARATAAFIDAIVGDAHAAEHRST